MDARELVRKGQPRSEARKLASLAIYDKVSLGSQLLYTLREF